jgi:hypothetical protein
VFSGRHGDVLSSLLNLREAAFSSFLKIDDTHGSILKSDPHLLWIDGIGNEWRVPPE